MADTNAVPPSDVRRSRRKRLAVIIVAGCALLGASAYVTKRHNDDVKAAQADVEVVANQLPGLVSKLDLSAVFAATSADHTAGRPETEFPGRPEVSGAELWAVSSTPDELKLTYRISSHGQEVCVTASRTTQASGVDLKTGSCSQV